MDSKINLALVGAGYWGKNLARVFHELDVLKWICDPSEKTLQRKLEKYPEIKTTVSFADIISCP
ncbi:MAG: oxidoreductase, partial [Nitrospinae bacterium]|nr:oxidoreductase [Nitrospinota bacterium]